MKLNSEIRNKIVANIVAAHAVSDKARSIIDDTHALAMRLLALSYPKGVTNSAEYREWFQAEKDRYSGNMFNMHYYNNVVSFYRDSDRNIAGVRRGRFDINVSGQAREISVSGDCYNQDGIHKVDAFSPWVGHIVPGYAISKMTDLIEFSESGEAKTIYLPYRRVVVPDDRTIAEIDRLDAARREVYAEHETLRLTIRGTLNKYGSDSKLIKAWPEVEPFIPAEVTKQSTAVALDTATLNAICGLPK